MSIKYKIVLLFVMLVTIIVTIGSITIYFFNQEERKQTFRIRLKNRALSTAKIYAGITDSNFTVLRRMDTAAVASLSYKSISIIALDNNHNYSYSDSLGEALVIPQVVIDKVKIENEYFFTYKNKQAVALHYSDSRTKFIIAVAALDIDGLGYLRQLKTILLFALVLAGALSFLAGLFFANSLIMPIKSITREVNLISSNDLSQRIKTGTGKDELTNLAATFNHLLDRLQESFATQRRFISNASHELSTPLTSISSQIEIAMQKERSNEEYTQVLQSVYEDTRQLQQLTRSLLDIAKTGTQGSLDLKEVRLDEVLFKIIADVQRQNALYKATLNFDIFPDDERLLSIFGSPNLIYIAFKNIIENGCKYADNNRSSVSVTFDKNKIITRVSNKGDIITESDIENIFQPFFRAETAQPKPGFGLGLTLTKRILSLHKGSIEVESDPETGTVFTIKLPNMLSE